jgi:hypothetical protein
MTNILYEDPWALRSRLKLGREEFCQRLLTMLIVGGPYPPWNTRNRPTAEGEVFLRRLHDLAGLVGWHGMPEFVDEFDLPRRHDDERGGAPDWAVVWPNRLWMIELKTESSSHRPGQLQSYATLAAHHHPDRQVEISYITPPLPERVRQLGPDGIVSHLLWGDVAPLVDDVWGSDDDLRIRAIAVHAVQVLGPLELPVQEWRAQVGALQAGAPESNDDRALTAATMTAWDAQQRGVDVLVEDLELLQELRLAVRDRIRSSDDESLRRVQPWIWRSATSGGHPLTEAGKEHGYELRMSRSAK